MKLRALIVEDCPTMRDVLKLTLPLTELAQFEFTEAKDGAEALARFNPARTDLIFMDWHMPGIAGIDVVRKIRASERGGRVPIVMVTGERTIGKIEEAMDEAGVDLFITKPFTIDQLRSQLEKLIERIAAEREARRAASSLGLLRERLTAARRQGAAPPRAPDTG